MKKFISKMMLSCMTVSCLASLFFVGGNVVWANPCTTDSTSSACTDYVNSIADANDAASVAEDSAEPSVSSAPCSVNEDDLTNSSTSIGDMLRPCRPTGVITTDNTASGDFKINGGARERVIALANQIILAGSLLAVGAIVYAAILYTIAAGDDEKIKKAKGSLKFGIIGFLMMLISFPLVNAIIKLFYTASS